MERNMDGNMERIGQKYVEGVSWQRDRNVERNMSKEYHVDRNMERNMDGNIERIGQKYVEGVWKEVDRNMSKEYLGSGKIICSPPYQR